MIFNAALIQTTTKRSYKDNASDIHNMVYQAYKMDAEFIFLPETCNFMESRRKIQFQQAEYEQNDKSLEDFRNLAIKYSVWLSVGSLVIKSDENYLANRSFVIDNNGIIVARYDKIHMFDVNLGQNQIYRESSIFKPGTKIVIARTPWGRLGMTICYDLRFPYIFQSMAKLGADFIAIPSAFTHLTGEAHWEVLLRARAIETGSFTIASAQTGNHENGRRTYGHSLVVDPWGNVLANSGQSLGVTIINVDTTLVRMAREKIPFL